MAYSSQYYDKQKAHEYYEKHKKLKGKRKSKAGLSEKGKKAINYVKAKLTNAKTKEVQKYKDEMNKQIQALKDELKGMSKAERKAKREMIMAKIKALREKNKQKKAELKKKYDDLYNEELDSIKSDKSMIKGGTSTSVLNDKGKKEAKKVKEKLTAQRKSDIEAHKKQMQDKISALREQLKNMTKEEREANREMIANQISALREEHKSATDSIKKSYDKQYVKELDDIKSYEEYRN